MPTNYWLYASSAASWANAIFVVYTLYMKPSAREVRSPIWWVNVGEYIVNDLMGLDDDERTICNDLYVCVIASASI